MAGCWSKWRSGPATSLRWNGWPCSAPRERDKACIAWAVSRFLDAAPHVSALGDALWPAEGEHSGQAC
jgi:hypothetical protein